MMAFTTVEPAETGAWEKRLNVRKRARADGAAGVPSADAREWSAAERDIISAVDGARRLIETERSEVAAKLESELRRLAPAAIDLETPIAEARLDLKQIQGRFAPEAGELRAQAGEARRHLAAFRDTHGLHRPAIYPASAIWQAGLLMLAAAFEALFSAALFAETDERGLLGGAVIALGLSGANVSLGFLSGFLGLRYLGHIKVAMKIAGGALFAIGFGLAAALNLFAAAWRNRIAEAEQDVSAMMDSAMLFGLTSPQAVILLMLGGGVWVFAALKGYSGFDDPYPDYGKMDRAARERGEDLADAREEAREAMEQSVEIARAKINDALETARDTLAPMRAAYDRASGTAADLDQRLRRACEAGNALVQLYRRENVAARAGAAPSYFSEAPPFAVQHEDALARCADILLTAQKDVEQAQARAGALLTELTNDLDAAGGALESGA
jgi:hypothetical protein